jgi:hypothetical protein
VKDNSIQINTFKITIGNVSWIDLQGGLMPNRETPDQATRHNLYEKRNQAFLSGASPLVASVVESFSGYMRDRRFVAQHRGGPLKKEQHFQLIQWACDCAENVLPLFGQEVDERLKNALGVAKDWKRGTASVGDARRASLEAIEVARECTSKTAIAVARSVGHAVATAHMADHSLGAALYALKAVIHSGNSPDAERKRQDEQLPSEIRDLVMSARKLKKI